MSGARRLIIDKKIPRSHPRGHSQCPVITIINHNTHLRSLGITILFAPRPFRGVRSCDLRCRRVTFALLPLPGYVTLLSLCSSSFPVICCLRGASLSPSYQFQPANQRQKSQLLLLFPNLARDRELACSRSDLFISLHTQREYILFCYDFCQCHGVNLRHAVR